ncbi:Medium-chain-fatty-acid--CoA ligase [Triticum urartu]|uniref:Medium-chain-fatty-acid--CoA ligase n=1 Tax=Triticum urartu TaxID=4572 RepID=M7ZPQ9_TRIUA|nr:Medium-chain-fatty-acid--CoA ligase [Triticum urartu]
MADLASCNRGIEVAVLSPNVPAMYELHFAVPMAGAILCTLNTRHDAAMVSALLKHSAAKVLFVESGLLEVGRAALNNLAGDQTSATALPVLITIAHDGGCINSAYNDYESLITEAPLGFDIRWPLNELDPIALNYTSGTTARPKGVIYSNWGAYLNTIATALTYNITVTPTYLWTVPMFHANGWNLSWGIAMQGGTNVCLRHFTAKVVFDKISQHKVTHMGGAPTVLNMIVNAPSGDRKPLPVMVHIMTGGAARPPNILSGMEELGFIVHQMYGLTETTGPATINTWMPEWDTLPTEERSRLTLPTDWGETPCAFVKLKTNVDATEIEIINYCRDKLPHYMAPKAVVFADLPKTSTGKTQKFILRQKARAMGSLVKT